MFLQRVAESCCDVDGSVPLKGETPLFDVDEHANVQKCPGACLE